MSTTENTEPQSRAHAEWNNRIRISFYVPLVVAVSLGGKKVSCYLGTDKTS